MSVRFAAALRRTIGTLAAGALIATPTLTFAQPAAVGINASVRNQVQIRRAGTPRPRPAVVRERVILNDEVQTGANSQLQIILLDRSTFTVGSNARMAIDRFVYDPARNSRSVGASVTRGAFRFMSGRTATRPSGPVTVRTPVASVGIRGTIFEGVVGADAMRIAGGEPAVGPNIRGDPKTATLLVLRGPGSLTQGDAMKGAIDVSVQNRTIVLDRPSLALYIPGPGLPPIGPFMLSTPGLMSFQSLLRTTPALIPAGAGPGQQGGSGAGAGGSASSPSGRQGGSGLSRFFAPLGVLAATLLGLALANDKGADLPTSP